MRPGETQGHRTEDTGLRRGAASVGSIPGRHSLRKVRTGTPKLADREQGKNVREFQQSMGEASSMRPVPFFKLLLCTSRSSRNWEVGRTFRASWPTPQGEGERKAGRAPSCLPNGSLCGEVVWTAGIQGAPANPLLHCPLPSALCSLPSALES